MEKENQAQKDYELFRECLKNAVEDWVKVMTRLPTQDEISNAYELAYLMLMKSDIMIRKQSKENDIAKLLDELSKAIAIISYDGEGIECFDLRFKNE